MNELKRSRAKLHSATPEESDPLSPTLDSSEGIRPFFFRPRSRGHSGHHGTPAEGGPMPGTWTPLTNQPTFPASTMLLLTDGTVLSQESGGKRWWRLWPDQHGNYINGTWSPQADMANTRLYYASAVLNDGRVFVAGGEYSDAGGDTNKAEIFNPVIDAWSALSAPPGWNNIGDAPTPA